MAIALVGSAGAAVTGTTTVSPSFGQTTSAGNLLVAWWQQDAGTSPTAPSGWTRLINSIITFFYKANCGAGETAPSFTAGGSGFVVAALAEFSGIATTSLQEDQGVGAGTASPIFATGSASSATTEHLICSVGRALYTMAATKTTSDTYLNGATPINIGNNDATSTVNHYRFAYGITNSNFSADRDEFAFTTTSISTADNRMVTFKPGAGGGGGTDMLDPFGQGGFFGA